jgi:copper chaperone
MDTLILEVENIKCGGCANGIKQRLQKVDASAEIDVDVTQGTVKITSDKQVDKEVYSDILKQMGYPEVGEGNLVTTAKSYVSCMIGKMS